MQVGGTTGLQSSHMKALTRISLAIKYGPFGR